MATVSFRISDELKSELDELSAEKGYHLSKLFRKAIEDLRDTMRHGPEGGTFDLTLKERLLLANQYRILELLEPDQAAKHAGNRQILAGAVETHYVTLLDDFSNAINLDLSREVMDILAMFTRLRLSFDHLGEECSVHEEAIAFGGFHPEIEHEMLSYARFYMKKLGRHRWLSEDAGQGLESSVPMLKAYRKMLEEWRIIGLSKVLDENEIRRILSARDGPAGNNPYSDGRLTPSYQ